jgi:hypothetical protein
MIKSSEEHDAIRRAVAAGERAIEVIRRTARPPSRHQGDIWLQTFNSMVAETGEDPTRLSIALDTEANATLGVPTDDPDVFGVLGYKLAFCSRRLLPT